MQPPPAASDLAASVQQTLHDEARLNELGLAAVRIVALAVAACLDLVFYLFPRQAVGLESVSAAHAALAFAWLGVAIGVGVALKRGRYTKASRIVLTVLDPIIILTLFLLIYGELRGTPKAAHPIVVTAVACALLATTGALRMSAFAAKLATLASIVTFAVVAFAANYTFIEALFVCGLIFAAGLLGMRLEQNTRRAVVAQANRVILRRFLPRHLSEGDPGAALEAVSRPRNIEATILVSDLRGFTAMVEKLSPEAALVFLNNVQGRLAECVRGGGGVVDKFMGDGLLAVFGAPEPLPGHAAAALRAALAMRSSIAALNAARDIEATGELRIGIGIHSGLLVAGCIGSGERLEFTVIGDTVNTAARLEAATKDLGIDIAVSGTTEALARGSGQAFPPLEPVGEIALRGKDRGVLAFRLAHAL